MITILKKNYSNKDKTSDEAKKLQLSTNSVTNESNNDSSKDCTDEDIVTVKYSLPKCRMKAGEKAEVIQQFIEQGSLFLPDKDPEIMAEVPEDANHSSSTKTSVNK